VRTVAACELDEAIAVSFGTGPTWPSKGMRETAEMDPELYSSQTQATRHIDTGQKRVQIHSTIRRSLTFSQLTVYDWCYQLEAGTQLRLA
jgi:hypothetical protein